MIQNDTWIKEAAAKGMIQPFVPTLLRTIVHDFAKGAFYADPHETRAVSYGLSSYGYDIRLSAKEFEVFRHVPGEVVNPKYFTRMNLERAPLHRDEWGDYFIIPAHSYGLGVAVEKLEVPDDVIVICTGKSTYARCGLIVNLTPAEPGWKGHLTLEISNSSSADCRVYANEGIAQLLFLRGEPCETSYADRSGKYQDQPEKIVLAKT